MTDPAATAAGELDPARTAIVVFDMLERARAAIVAAGCLEPVRRLVAAGRAAGAVVVWARADHRPDGAEFAATRTDVDPEFRPWTPDHPQPTRPAQGSGAPGLRVLPELGQHQSDVDLPKHRWSAFCGTPLDLYLRAMRRDTVVLAGGSTHVGIASTAFAARDLDYQVIVVRDGCYGAAEQRAFFLDRVFPRMCRVRTASELLGVLSPRGAP